jgi:hypothetical protein
MNYIPAYDVAMALVSNASSNLKGLCLIPPLFVLR